MCSFFQADLSRVKRLLHKAFRDCDRQVGEKCGLTHKKIMKIKLIIALASLPAWFLILENRETLTNFSLKQLGINTAALIGFVSGCQAVEEYLFYRKKNRTPESPAELIRRWEDSKQLVDYVEREF